jgi:hypothetical protein
VGFLGTLFVIEKLLVRFQPIFRESKQDRLAMHVGFMNIYLGTLFLLYPSLSKTIFQTFSLVDFDDGRSFIRIDKQIEVGTGVYTSLFVYALFTVAVYVLGVPVLFSYLLDKQRFDL